MAYYLLIDGEQVGPLELGAAAEMIEQGTVTRDTLAWTGGMADWAAVSEIPALAALFDEPHRRATQMTPVQAPSQSTADTDQPLDIERAFNTAFVAFKGQFGPTFLVSVLYNLISSSILVLIFGMAVITGVTADGEDPEAQFVRFSLVGVVLMMVVMPILYGGMSTAMLSMVRKEPVRPSQLLAGFSRALVLVAFWLLYAIGCSIGMLLFVVPALLVGASFMLTPFVIMESQLGVIDSMKAGYRAAVSLGWWRCVFFAVILLIVVLVVGIVTEALFRSLANPLITFVGTLLINSLVTVFMVGSLAAAYEQARANRERAAANG